MIPALVRQAALYDAVTEATHKSGQRGPRGVVFHGINIARKPRFNTDDVMSLCIFLAGDGSLVFLA
jgi:hypothetical protein